MTSFNKYTYRVKKKIITLSFLLLKDTSIYNLYKIDIVDLNNQKVTCLVFKENEK